MYNPMDRDQKVIKNDEETYKQIIEYSFETTVIHSNHKVLYINEAGVKLLRAKKKKDLIGANVKMVPVVKTLEKECFICGYFFIY